MATNDQDLHIGDVFREIAALSSLSDILELVRMAVTSLGANRTSYHFTPKLKSQTDHTVQLATSGFSKEWLTLYEEAGFRKSDPIPDIIMQHGEPMLWRDALESRRLNENERRFVDQLQAHGLIEGVGIPLFGPKGRDAYSAFTFDPLELTFDDSIIATVAALASAAHIRICYILDQKFERKVHLSERETQVIRLIAHGRSNKAIAAELEIGGSTADTYVRRVFAKLDASDRTGASIRALELGVLRL
ncbi:helix-turn-helix transcriptional regulator [Parasphingorhabdus cellanae]|uniref:Autoinducer binding domain-containing protein n=1 Tax=Parasphingorhabdus cellanae TaxID=2806553 RepID=A0ABX7TA45_9SPHN|nr:autoinducer binding domain-containing protein [Parasphingorhabdus cellanae]QTD57527.1 autoinducer binding domain-containing protein [Parasphingorhabdus cellanae]